MIITEVKNKSNEIILTLWEIDFGNLFLGTKNPCEDVGSNKGPIVNTVDPMSLTVLIKL